VGSSASKACAVDLVKKLHSGALPTIVSLDE
jgi:hypothetical protein